MLSVGRLQHKMWKISLIQFSPAGAFPELTLLEMISIPQHPSLQCQWVVCELV